MKKQKKRWETPKLICLYRGRSEEAVLAACKTAISNAPGPNAKLCAEAPGGCRIDVAS